MRLLHPNPGECADRQSILQLKAKAGDTGEVSTKADEVSSPVGRITRTVIKGAGKINIEPFLLEHEEIQRHLEREWFVDYPQVGDQYDQLFDELAEVNAKLWKLEDEIRSLRQSQKGTATMYRAGTVAFEIADLNDKRAELVKQINELFGVSVVEKIYA